MQTQNEGNGTVQFLMKIYWAGIWTKSRMIPSSIPSKQMKFSYWNKRKLKLGMTMNEMNDIRDMSHSKSERKQKRPILKLFINKFSPISLKKWINSPPPRSECWNYFRPALTGVKAEFYLYQVELDRRRTPVLLQVYLTTGLFVIVSWISFIVPPEVVPGEESLL